MSDLRVSNNAHRGGRGGGRRRGGRMSEGGAGHDSIRVPQADYDFESANAKFDKTAAGRAAKSSGDDSGTSDDAAEATSRAAYNPKHSFFDEISSSASGADRGGGRGRRGGAGGAGSVGRTRREEEREKNFVTFGETGGVGMLNRDLVGHTGYSRRVGGRPRRGSSRGGANAQAAVARG